MKVCRVRRVIEELYEVEAADDATREQVLAAAENPFSVNIQSESVYESPAYRKPPAGLERRINAAACGKGAPEAHVRMISC
jgi:hypothetical protein